MEIDWDRLMRLTYENISEDQAEQLCEQFIQYEPSGKESLEQMQKLFNLSRVVMQIKSIKAEVAINEIQELRSSSDQRRTEVDRVRQLRNENEQLRNEIFDKDTILKRESAQNERLQQQLGEGEKRLQQLHSELDGLREEITSERKQWTEQLAESELPFQKLRQLNQRFGSMLEQLRDLEHQNEHLSEECQTLKEELNAATVQIRIAARQLQQKQRAAQRAHSLNKQLLNEKEHLEQECEVYRQLVQKLEQQEQTIPQLPQQLIDLIKKKDEITHLKSELPKERIPTEKSRDESILVELERREHQVRLLQEQLDQASRDMESQTKIIEDLLFKQRMLRKRSASTKSSTTLENEMNSEGNDQLDQLKQMVNQLEEELKQKDKQLNLLDKKNLAYEQGVYGLPEALAELRSLRSEHARIEKELEMTVQELNQTNQQLNEQTDRLEYLQEWIQAEPELRAQWCESVEHISQERLKILKLQKELLRLEAENLELLEQRNDAIAFTTKENVQEDDEERKDQKRVKWSNQKSNENIEEGDHEQHFVSLNSLDNINQQLQRENQQLQLAMKEILYGLKESDGKADVVIECPALERLCSQMEARALNAPLANVIALKAELDLLRGQNDELRVSNKRLRAETFNLINGYIRFFMEELEETRTDGEMEEDEELKSSLADEDSPDESEIKKLALKNEISSSQEDEQQQLVRAIAVEHKSTNTFEPEMCHKSVQAFLLQVDSKKEDQLKTDFTTFSAKLDEKVNEMLIKMIDATVQTDDYKETIKTDSKLVQTDSRSSLSNTKFSAQSVQTDERLLSQWILSRTQDEPQKSEDGLSLNGQKCSVVQNLLLELQEKMERIEKSIMDREQTYVSRVEMLQEENTRLEVQLQDLAKQGENLLEQKEQEIAESRNQLQRLKEKLFKIETSHTENVVTLSDTNINESKDQSKNFGLMVKKNGMANVEVGNSTPVCVNILETIIKCLQARIQYKDESIAYYQRIEKEMRNNYEQQIRDILDTGTNEAPNSMQIRQAITNEQLEVELAQRNEELRTMKLTQQKYIRELRRRLELQHCQLKKLKNENERLKSSKSLIQINQLRSENEKLKNTIEFNSNQIEQLKLNLKEERSARLHKQSKLMKKSDVKSINERSQNEINQLRKQLEEKESQIRELELNKWCNAKRKEEILAKQTEQIRHKQQELDKCSKELEKFKQLLLKSEKEISLIKKASSRFVIREQSAQQSEVSTQTV